MASDTFSIQALEKLGLIGALTFGLIWVWRAWRETAKELRESLEARIRDKETHAERLAQLGTESMRGIAKAADANKEALQAVKSARSESSQK